MPATSISRRSSKTSIVSIEPAVASQITSTNSKARATGHAGHTRTESTPARATTVLPTTATRGHGRTASAPHRNPKKRSNSLKRAKNSTELLKSRSAAAEKGTKAADQAPVKRGRNFTVSNVATGGLLHLSPAPHQQPFSTAVVSSSPYPWMPQTAPIDGTALPIPLVGPPDPPPGQVRTRSVSPKQMLSRVAQTKTSREIFRPQAHVRSQSFSTVDESRRSVAASLQPRTLKIVINRPESVHSSEEEDLAPTLQIPIPHYKLGTPRFSAHGTPFIRGSSYTRASDVPSVDTSTVRGVTAGPPPASIRALSRIQNFQSSDESIVPMPDPLRVNKGGDNLRSASMASFVSPITSDLYDKLLSLYHDPTVVRYASDNDIAAATKIRIIAQISSESFMDYDLVSDFFLTFRSYMTTFEVLDYLLARLRWAIGRLSEDGRIIRIRTFAALRHWILNYFEDDFVINRRLRVRFCEEVNDLYFGVRQRPRGVGGASDLKILQDLKRCWNGRCALYWDAEQFSMDASQEDPLLPGGVIGSRDPTFADITEATAALGLGLQGIPTTSSIPTASSRSVRKTQHKRLPSSEYAKKPISIESEKSLHATSCSLPRYHSRSPDKSAGNPGRAPQPVSVLSRRQNAPSDLKVHVHARSNSRDEGRAHSATLDHSRAQTPVEVLANSGQYADPHAGSMIRGFVYGPVEPFVQLPTHPPLSPAMRFSADQHDAAHLRIPQSPQAPNHAHQGPAVKNIFGSIRRALSGKQGSNEVTLITVSAPRPNTSDPSRRTQVALNLAKSNDDLRKKATAATMKTQLRIDLLCAAAVQSFQSVAPGSQDAITRTQHAPILPKEIPFSPPLSSPEVLGKGPTEARLPSHYTARSGSILIVDDTAVPMPVMSGALPHSPVRYDIYESTVRPDSEALGHAHHPSFDTQIAFSDEETTDTTPRVPQSHEMPNIPTIDPRSQQQVVSRAGSSVTIRRVNQASGPPPTEPPDSLRSNSPPSMTEATSKSESPISKAPVHGLRRRPGGDLRKNQNVQDLEPAIQHQSLDSILETRSPVGSVTFSTKSITVKSTPEKARQKSNKVSMINTHSSQQLRPSFEAAVAGFSSIPDDDDGGLEATLLKLEGLYEDKSPTLSQQSMSPRSQSFTVSSEVPVSASTMPTDHENIVPQGYRHNKTPLKDVSFLHDDGAKQDDEDGMASPKFAHKSAVFGLPTESPVESDSEESEISLPILQRPSSIGQAITTDSPHPYQKNDEEDENDEARSSSDILEAPPNQDWDGTRPTTAATEGAKSFLLDDDENISDLSSEISVDIINYSGALGKPLSPMLTAPGTAISGLEIPSHPLTHASLVNLQMHTSPTLGGATHFQHHLPTPQSSPQLGQQGLGVQHVPVAVTKSDSKLPLIKGPTHAPFVLACDSQVLAQQLTIVEQSALTEIEWTDLVEMRWNNDKSVNTLDWAEYMAKHDDARGIDVVSARFNLVHKWVQSEIVLTQDIEERARVLSKFIHVAAHARRLHNYATMLQITIALTMTSIARLKKTWELVSGPDRSLLKHMEDLARPMRNFHDLRVEMESTDLTTGCIPFLGLYVHDLTYNANKPAEIKLAESPEPLINFDRFRTAAIIIKGLLRLIDASLRYDFEPIHGIIERCLWLSALTDERIDTLSRSLEQ